MGKRFNHPSGIQMFNGTFPVAMAGKENQDSQIEFYQITEGTLKYLKQDPIKILRKHIGALAYTSINNTTYMIGVGWDAKDLSIWQAAGTGATSGFRQTTYAKDARSLISDSDKNAWGPYNSLWLGQLHDERIILIGTHGKSSYRESRMDIWQIDHIGTSDIRLHKLSTKTLSKKTPDGTNYFFEGIAVRQTGPGIDGLKIYAAPHDFISLGRRNKYRISDGIYEISLSR